MSGLTIAAEHEASDDVPRFTPPHRLKVCMVHFSDFHTDSRLQREAAAILDHGGRVDCVCLSPSGEAVLEGGRVQLHGIDLKRRRGGAGGYLGNYLNFLVRATLRVALLDRRRRFDLVEAHNMPDALVLAGLGPRLRGVPVVLNVHDTFPELFETTIGSGASPRLRRLVRIEERLSAAFAAGVVVVTPEARERLASRGIGVGRTEVVMNSPDEGIFGPSREPALHTRGTPLRTIYHGGLADRFGPDVLVGAFGLLRDGPRDITLTVLGADTGRERVAALAQAQAPDAVSVSPASIPFRRIPEQLAAHHVGIVPTLRDPFTELLLPVKLLEYVHMGLPIVAARLPVIERYFTEDEIMWFEPGSTEALADALVAVHDDFESARERARRASATLERLAWPGQRAAYLSLLDSLVAESRRGHPPRLAGPARVS